MIKRSIYELTESSTKENRAKFEKLLKMVGEFEEPIAIVTDTVDRLQRSFKESVELDTLRKKGKIELHFTDPFRTQKTQRKKRYSIP